jgi:hypothetical protein
MVRVTYSETGNENMDGICLIVQNGRRHDLLFSAIGCVGQRQ